MNLNRVATIFRKELLDTLRDRKTLIFMLLVPTLATPLLLIGLAWIVETIVREQATKTVKIVAEAPVREAYIREAHEWFQGTEIGGLLRSTDSGFLKALLRPGPSMAFDRSSTEWMNDEESFYEWSQQLSQRVRAGLDSPKGQLEGPILDLSDPIRERLLEFYQVIIKGLGLIEFVNPDSLPPAPDKYKLKNIPAELKDLPYARDLAYAIEEKEVEGYLHIPEEIDRLGQDEERQVKITLLHDSTISLSREAFERIKKATENMGRRVVLQRLEARNLSERFIEPMTMDEEADLATKSEILLALVGGIFPMILIIYCFMGGMYPAIDLGAGEKERNTLETLLLSPAHRTEIALGKFFVIMLTAMVAALLGMAAVWVSLRLVLPQQLIELIDLSSRPAAIVMLMAMTLPPAATFSGILLAISIFARTFKEAQNYMAPLQLLALLPALAAILPGVELNWKLAMFPLVNVSLLCRDGLQGDFNWLYFALTLLSSLLLAALCLLYAIRQFNREEVLFRS